MLVECDTAEAEPEVTSALMLVVIDPDLGSIDSSFGDASSSAEMS